MKPGWIPAVLGASLLLTGCVVGQKHTLTTADPALSLAGDGTLAVAVTDRRSYVLSANKPPSFLGLLRNGFGVPFDVNTRAGRPVAEEVAEVLATSLEEAGFLVTTLAADGRRATTEIVAEADGRRLLLLRLVEFKSDTFVRTRLDHDLELSVYDAVGVRRGHAVVRGSEELGSGIDTSAHVRGQVPLALARYLEQLLADETVVAALR